jgi:hypothetical protein
MVWFALRDKWVWASTRERQLLVGNHGRGGGAFCLMTRKWRAPVAA